MTNLKGGGPEKFGAFRSFLYEHWAAPSLAPLHRRIASEVPIQSGLLLDIGCGPGDLDRILAAERSDLSILGLDESEAMVRRAARSAGRAGLANLEFRRGAVESLSLREEFDFALSVLSFHHWEEPEAGLEAVHRALRPEGRFWIYEGDPEASRSDLLRDQRPLFGWLRLPEGLVRKGLRGHGFTAAEADRVVRPAVARTSFRTCEISRSGSMLRISVARQS
jgi:SAM-dependent methyltransferase